MYTINKMADLAYLMPYHREIARRLVQCQSLSEIGGAIGLSAARLKTIINAPLFKLELQKLEEIREKSTSDVRSSFAEIAPIAVDTIERLMYKGSTESIQLRAAETILDRGGHGSISRGTVEIEQNVTISHADLTERELRELVLKRVNKIQTEKEKQTALEDSANAMEVAFEVIDDKTGKIPMGMLG